MFKIMELYLFLHPMLQIPNASKSAPVKWTSWAFFPCSISLFFTGGLGRFWILLVDQDKCRNPVVAFELCERVNHQMWRRQPETAPVYPQQFAIRFPVSVANVSFRVDSSISWAVKNSSRTKNYDWCMAIHAYHYIIHSKDLRLSCFKPSLSAIEPLAS